MSSLETKKVEPNYIFERLTDNNRKFITVNNNHILKTITAERPKEKEDFDIKQKMPNLNQRKSQENFHVNSNIKTEILIKNRSISELRGVPATKRKNKNNIHHIVSSVSELCCSKYNKNESDIKLINNKDNISKNKCNDMNNSKEKIFNTTIRERRNVNRNIFINKNSPKKNNCLSVKKYLFKNTENKKEENKAKNEQNIDKNNKLNSNNELNNSKFRKIYHDSNSQLNINNKINFWREIKFNKISNDNSKNDCPYSSSSMIVIKKKNEDQKPFYDTISKYKTNTNYLIKKRDVPKEDEDILNTPDDIVKVTSIEKMEKIPLNPAIFTNPLLANNIQQRIKHVIFRGRLPTFNVDNYTIKKTLGEGTNGIIYQVMNNISKKFYAMKKIIANSIPELDFLQKEFQICYQNPHKYVLTIYGICVRCFDANTFLLYVLMPLAEKDLEIEISERIRRKKYYKEEELITMIKQLVEALFYLQSERHVAHRDIKPENILIFKNHVLKLADFGEAKINSDNKKKKTIRGTEFYMSPILYEGNLKSKFDIQHNPFKSDVFSLGYCFIFASALDAEIINEIRQVKDLNKIKIIFKKYFPKEYSEKYINLLLKMITSDENERVDFIGLYKILQNY